MPQPASALQPPLVVDEATLLAEIVRRVVDAVAPECIVLFGSRARGPARPASDVDLLVIRSRAGPGGPGRFAIAGQLHGALRRIGVDRDILVVSREEARRLRQWRGHVVATALVDGRCCMANSERVE